MELLNLPMFEGFTSAVFETIDSVLNVWECGGDIFRRFTSFVTLDSMFIDDRYCTSCFQDNYNTPQL